MAKLRKILFIILALVMWGSCVITGILLLSPLNRGLHASRSPDNFPNTVWSTTNGEMVFRVEEEWQVFLEDTTDDNRRTTRMFAEITVGETTYNCFVEPIPHEMVMVFVSQEIPRYCESEDEFYDMLSECQVAEFCMTCKSKKHFVLEVTGGELFEIGTKFDVYRVDSE